MDIYFDIFKYILDINFVNTFVYTFVCTNVNTNYNIVIICTNVLTTVYTNSDTFVMAYADLTYVITIV